MEDETGEMVPILLEDCVQAAVAQERNDSPFARRQLVRAAFAAIEAALQEIRRKLLLSKRSQTFDASVVSILRDEAYSLDDRGEVVKSQKFCRFESAVLFLVRLYTQPLRSSRFVINKSRQEWTDLRVALKARNRITHPKTEKDLEVSKAEYLATSNTLFWIFGLLQDAATTHLEREKRQIRNQRAAIEAQKKAFEERKNELLRGVLEAILKAPPNPALNPTVGRGRPPAG